VTRRSLFNSWQDEEETGLAIWRLFTALNVFKSRQWMHKHDSIWIHTTSHEGVCWATSWFSEVKFVTAIYLVWKAGRFQINCLGNLCRLSWSSQWYRVSSWNVLQLFPILLQTKLSRNLGMSEPLLLPYSWKFGLFRVISHFSSICCCCNFSGWRRIRFII